MKREYSHGAASDIVYFIGSEIEKTNQFGEITLFVAGPRPTEEILSFSKPNNIQHIFASANQTLNKWTKYDVHIIEELLATGLKVTLDGPIAEWDRMMPFVKHLADNKNFTIIVSVPIPDIAQYQAFFNVYLKLDDIGFNATNAGVYVSPFADSCNDKYITYWNQYSSDEVLARVRDLK